MAMTDYYSQDGLAPGRGARMSPFRTYSSFVYPRNIAEVTIWAVYLWERNPKYRSAIERICSYFISGVSVESIGKQEDVDTDDVENFKERLENVYETLELVNRFGLELAAMGNAYVSCERIFTRWLLCPKCRKWEMNLAQLHKGRDYEWTGKSFQGICPQCHKHVTFEMKDVPGQAADGSKVRFVFRDPRDIYIQLNRLTGERKYFYKMPADVKDAIKRGDEVYLESTPSVFLDVANSDSAVIEFPHDLFFADHTMTLAPMEKYQKGFSLPLFMSSFDDIIRLATLDRFSEVICMDFINPLRIISPEAANLKAGVDDPNRMPMSGATFRSFIQQSLRKTRENSSSWVISPVPVKYNLVGGEGQQLAPTDLLEHYTSQMYADMNIPQELRSTTFQVVAPSMGLRLFERQWAFFAKSLHKFTNWVGQKVCDAENIENMRVDLDVTSFVEDDMNKQVLLSLMQAGVIAKTNVLKRLGVDFNKDLDQRMQEQKAEQEAAMEMQTQDEGQQMVQSVMPPPGSLGVGQAQMAIQAGQGGEGAPAGPAMPAGPAAPMGAESMQMGGTPGGGQPGTPEQMWQQASDMASQLYNAPPNVRRSQLVNLKATNPQMHSFVKSILSQMEQQVASDAVAQSKAPQG